MTNIQLNREEIIKLLSEIDATHWLNDRLLNALTSNVAPAFEHTPVVEKNSFNFNKTAAQKTEKPAMSIEEAFLTTEMDIEMKYSVNNLAELTGCKWETYGNYCNRENEEGAEYCWKHNGETCNYCNNQTTHGCPEEMQWVCGEYLCDNHRHNGAMTYRQ